MTSTAQPGLDDIKAIFRAHGGTAEDYLNPHWHRFCVTKREIEATRPLTPQGKVLDVGAHWLHQAALYALADQRVWALDLSLTLGLPNVIEAADALGIHLLPNDDLEHVPALRDVPDDEFDLVLFTEIIEHITFNPVAMWREIYRVTKPGGRIAVTTPNYYALRGRLWDVKRFVQRFGGGLEVMQILGMHTYAHHWKEYSLRELIYYFCVLSPDFECIKTAAMEEYSEGYVGKRKTWLGEKLERRVPLLRPNLHLEVQIRTKDKGIVIEPHW